MDYIKVSAKTVSDAIIEASIQLETSSDNIEYEVLENGSSGFLGFGSKPAVIRARKKESVEDILDTPFYTTQESVVKKEEKPVKKEPVRKDIVKQESVKKEVFKKESIKKESIKKDSFKREPAYKEVKESAEEVREVKETVKVSKAPVNKEEAQQSAYEFLQGVFKAMEMNVEIKAEFLDDTLSVDLNGDDMGVLIGKRGQTLDSLQYLTSLVVNKGKASYTRVKLDTENYRNRRKETLENLARNIAFKVKKTKRPVFLEPMNPYERRIIHSALQNDPYVTTHSEGEEPYRKVVVTLKK